MNLKKLVAAFAILIISISSVQAQAIQRHRIKQGVKSGELTRLETRRLVKQQRAIKQDKREARADGVITATERKEIRKDKRKASRNIYRKKHNNRDRI